MSVEDHRKWRPTLQHVDEFIAKYGDVTSQVWVKTNKNKTEFLNAWHGQLTSWFRLNADSTTLFCVAHLMPDAQIANAVHENKCIWTLIMLFHTMGTWAGLVSHCTNLAI